MEMLSLFESQGKEEEDRINIWQKCLFEVILVFNREKFIFNLFNYILFHGLIKIISLSKCCQVCIH